MSYQDKWIKGQMVERGERECATRYALIRNFCAQYSRPFTVLDLGANLGYFTVRLAEDFPDCTAVAFEGSQYGEEAQKVFEANDNPRTILLRRDLSLSDLRALADCEHFDVVLGLSVIHHFPGPWETRLDLFRSLGDHLILELANEPSACGGRQKEYKLPPEATLLGYGDSHLETATSREIVLLSQPKDRIIKAYLGSPRTDLVVTIISTFDEKRIKFWHKSDEHEWIRGINLQTYLHFGGVWPRRESLSIKLGTMVHDEEHGDIQPWNVVVSGDNVSLIDAADPNMTVHFDDFEQMDKLQEALRG